MLTLASCHVMNSDVSQRACQLTTQRFPRRLFKYNLPFRCKKLQMFHQLSLCITQLIVGGESVDSYGLVRQVLRDTIALQIFRVYGIYHRSQRVLSALVALALLTCAVVAVSCLWLRRRRQPGRLIAYSDESVGNGHNLEYTYATCADQNTRSRPRNCWLRF